MLYKQLAVSELEQVGVPMGTGLDDILETIRIHWERDVEKNRMEAETSLQSKVRGGPAPSCPPYTEGGHVQMENSLHTKGEMQCSDLMSQK